MRVLRVLVPLTILIASFSAAQEAAKPVPPISPYLRLTSAKNIFIQSKGGSDIPYNVISTDMQGWGRYVLVKTPQEADLIMEITAPFEGNSGISVSSSTKTGAYGRPEDSVSSTRDLSRGGGIVKLVVYDAHTKGPLWSASQEAKSGMRQKTREDNLVKAAETVFTKFHDRIEPPPPPAK